MKMKDWIRLINHSKALGKDQKFSEGSWDIGMTLTD